jgi:hypothetical protein
MNRSKMAVSPSSGEAELHIAPIEEVAKTMTMASLYVIVGGIKCHLSSEILGMIRKA